MSFHSDLITSLGVKVTRLVTDSRAVAPGDTFIAYPGCKADGRQFIKQAIANGANAVIWEAHGFSWNEAWQLPNLAVADLRHHAGEIADHVYAALRRNCGRLVSPAPTARHHAATGLHNRFARWAKKLR